jgi:quinol monooxygenase YgiN
MFVVTVTFDAHPDHVDNFARLLLEQAQNSLKNEVACQRFDVARNTENPKQFFLYEIYRDAESFAAHLETEHFICFNRQAEPLVTGKQVQTWQLSYP